MDHAGTGPILPATQHISVAELSWIVDLTLPTLCDFPRTRMNVVALRNGPGFDRELAGGEDSSLRWIHLQSWPDCSASAWA
jgi:hypothetical protein